MCVRPRGILGRWNREEGGTFFFEKGAKLNCLLFVLWISHVAAARRGSCCWYWHPVTMSVSAAVVVTINIPLNSLRTTTQNERLLQDLLLGIESKLANGAKSELSLHILNMFVEARHAQAAHGDDETNQPMVNSFSILKPCWSYCIHTHTYSFCTVLWWINQCCSSGAYINSEHNYTTILIMNIYSNFTHARALVNRQCIFACVSVCLICVRLQNLPKPIEKQFTLRVSGKTASCTGVGGPQFLR